MLVFSSKVLKPVLRKVFLIFKFVKISNLCEGGFFNLKICQIFKPVLRKVFLIFNFCQVLKPV